MWMNRTPFRALSLALGFTLTVTPLATGITSNAQSEDAVTFYQQGQALFTAEKFDEAVKAFSQAIKLKPDYVDAYYRLGETYSEIHEYKKALDVYKQVVRYQPNSALAYKNLGEAYSDVSDYKKAIEAYAEAIRLDPKAPDAHYKLGVIHAQSGKKELAVAEYKTLATLDASVAQDLYNLLYKPTIPVVADGSVRLNIIAVDSHGVPITGLMTDDFRVVEDGTPQNVSLISKLEPSVLYGLSVDTSGSLRPAFSRVIDTSKQIVEKTLPADQTLLIRFISSDKIETIQEFTSDKARLTREIDNLYIEGGQSAVLDAVYLCAQRLAGYKFPKRNVRRVLLLLTDGEDRVSYYTLAQVVALLRSIDIQIFAISFSNDNDGKLNRNPPQKSVTLLRTLTSETGGSTFFPTSAAELKATVNAIFDWVRSEYTIEYKPTKPIEAGAYRTLSVSIAPNSQHQNSTVIARAGYTLSAKKEQ